MSAPKIPSELVYLGDAVEVDGGESSSWMWKPTDKMIVASDSSGRRIFVFRQKKPVKNPSGEILYEKFNHRKSNGTKSFDVPQPKIRAARVHHIVYRSSKDGTKKSYIHTFDKQPIVWVDRKKNPNVLVLQGGKIRVTSRGITG